MYTDFNEAEKAIENLRLLIERIVDVRMRECVRAKPATVLSVSGDRCELLAYDTDKMTDVKVVPGTVIKAGDRVLCEFFQSLNLAFVRTKVN